MIRSADSEGPDQCADAQADLGLRCPHMPKYMFSRGTPINNLEENKNAYKKAINLNFLFESEGKKHLLCLMFL